MTSSLKTRDKLQKNKRTQKEDRGTVISINLQYYR